MKSKICAILILIFAIAIVFLFPTIRGIYRLKLVAWEEDRYKGRPLSDLRASLTERGVDLSPASEGQLYPTGEPRLPPDQRLFKFRKGKEFKWFFFGRGVNMGYVIVQQEKGGPIVVEIIRRQSVDAF